MSLKVTTTRTIYNKGEEDEYEEITKKYASLYINAETNLSNVKTDNYRTVYIGDYPNVEDLKHCTFKSAYDMYITNPHIDCEWFKYVATHDGFLRLGRLTIGNGDYTHYLSDDLFDILAAKNVGCIRDGPSLSGKYGRPVSIINLKLRGTNIKLDKKDLYYHVNDYGNYMEIKYRHPETDEATFPSTRSIKHIEVYDW